MGKLRHDPFAMLPFCGYHMGDYFAHWLSMGRKTTADKLPRIYTVNWFRKGADGKFLWPGFGENSRVLKWIFERTSHKAGAKESPIGNLPDALDLPPSTDLAQLLAVNPLEWEKEVEELASYFKLFGEKLPQEILTELDQVRQRLRQI